MPPRISALRRCLACTSHRPSSLIENLVAPGLSALQQQQTRSASIISSLSDNASAYNKRIRRGRGPASGKGKTSGRGHKGQKQHGKVPAGFNGGQTPDIVVSGTRGYVNPFSVDMTPINLDRIQEWINVGRLDPSKPITLRELSRSRCVHGIKDGIKLLARGSTALQTPINIVVSRASAQAIAAVESAGGTVLTRYYTPFSIKKIRAGLSDPIMSLQSAASPSALPFRTLGTSAKPATTTRNPDDGASATQTTIEDGEPIGQDASTSIIESRLAGSKYPFRLPDPTSRKDIEYYRDPAHRGYLAWQLKEGEGPSLFFKTPGLKKLVEKRAGKAKKGNAASSRLW